MITIFFTYFPLKTKFILLTVKVSLVLTLTINVMSQAPCQTGEPDTSFGINGKVFKSLGSPYGGGTNIALQANGKIVVVTTIPDFNVYPELAPITLFRYNSNGSIDQTFNGTGTKNVNFYAKSLYNAHDQLIVQKDGKIIIATVVQKEGKYPVVLARLNEDGSEDNSFGSNSVVYVDFFKPIDYAENLDGLLLQSDGKILVVGHSFPPNSGLYNYGIARYNPDGTLDQSFGSEGKTLISLSTFYIHDITVAAVQTDDKVVVAVETSLRGPIGTPGIALLRFNPNGSVDRKFGIRRFFDARGGVSQLPANLPFIGTTYQSYLNAISFKSGGSIITSLSGSNSSLVQFLPNTGVVDSRFGYDGVAPMQAGFNSAKMVFVQPDDKIVSLHNNGYIDVLVRQNSDGTLDDSFGSQGKVLFQLIPPNYSGLTRMATQQSNGDFIVFGSVGATNPVDSGFVLMRFRSCMAK